MFSVYWTVQEVKHSVTHSLGDRQHTTFYTCLGCSMWEDLRNINLSRNRAANFSLSLYSSISFETHSLLLSYLFNRQRFKSPALSSSHSVYHVLFPEKFQSFPQHQLLSMRPTLPSLFVSSVLSIPELQLHICCPVSLPRGCGKCAPEPTCPHPNSQLSHSNSPPRSLFQNNTHPVTQPETQKSLLILYFPSFPHIWFIPLYSHIFSSPLPPFHTNTRHPAIIIHRP